MIARGKLTQTFAAFSTPLSPKSILDAQLTALNTLYILSPNISELNRNTMREYDVEFVERDSLLLDAFSHPATSSPSTVLLPPTTCLAPNPAILSPSTLTGGPIVYPSGTVHTVGMNPYLIEVLHAPNTAYVGEDRGLDVDEAEVEGTIGGKGGKEALLSGKRASLVSAMQTRANVRVGFVGSGAMLSDKYWGVKVQTPDGKRWVWLELPMEHVLNHPVVWRPATRASFPTLRDGSSRRQGWSRSSHRPTTEKAKRNLASSTGSEIIL